MISVKSFSPKVKSMNSSFIKNMNIFDIFYHFPQFEQTKSEVWKGKNLCPWGVKRICYTDRTPKLQAYKKLQHFDSYTDGRSRITVTRSLREF